MNIRKLMIAMVVALGLLAALGATSASARPDPGAGATAFDQSGTTVTRADGTRVKTAERASTSLQSGNSNASVSGVGYCSNINRNADCWTWNTSAGTPCPASHFCIYTTTTATPSGKVFSFYRCTNGGSEWALQNWDDMGYYSNQNSGGAHAYIKDRSHRTLPGGDISAGASGYFNYYPAWFVRAC